MDKVRFGVVGTNFISDWVIAGARQDERLNLVNVYGILCFEVEAIRRLLSSRIYSYRIRLPPWRRWRKAR